MSLSLCLYFPANFRIEIEKTFKMVRTNFLNANQTQYLVLSVQWHFIYRFCVCVCLWFGLVWFGWVWFLSLSRQLRCVSQKSKLNGTKRRNCKHLMSNQRINCKLLLFSVPITKARDRWICACLLCDLLCVCRLHVDFIRLYRIPFLLL